MSAEHPGHPSITGIGCATRDLIVTAPPDDISDFLSTLPSHAPVAFGIHEPERLAHRQFAASHGHHSWTPGGTVPNTLCGVAAVRHDRHLDLGTIAWRGPAEHGDSVLSDIPLAHMREWGIAVWPVYPANFVREAYCLVDSTTGDVRRISIFEREPQVLTRAEWTSCDVLILTISDFVGADAVLLEYVRNCGRVALLVADWRPPSRSRALRDRLEAMSNVAFILGQQRDHVELGLCDAEARNYDDLVAEVECVGTDGPHPMVWKKAGARAGVPFPLEGPAHDSPANMLGAGDGYAGAFLACRVAGFAPADAHAMASSHARNVIRSRASWAARADDLNCVFPTRLARRSHSTTEGAIAKRVHSSPGLVITSCGQTGIDQIAMQQARSLGITSFAIMPQGRRTECSELGIGGPDRLDGTIVLELATPSYRFCTWANVFVSDGTLLVDRAGSEGSEETRRAAAWFGRPVMELQETGGADIAPDVTSWIDRHGIRVVNCAGTRMSLLGETGRAESGIALSRALLAAAAAVARRDCGIRTSAAAPTRAEPESPSSVVLGAPNSAVMRHVLRSFLLDERILGAGEAKAVTPGQLSWRIPSPPEGARALPPGGPLEIVFARGRDLPGALRRGWVDYAVFGEDLQLEDGDAIEPLFPLGLDACCLVEIRRHAGEARPHPVVAGSAWPTLAHTLLNRDRSTPILDVIPVTGCVEAWLRLGRVDSALDTYQTGRAVEENGLQVTRRFRTVHSWMHRRADSRQPVHPLISAFARWLHGSADVIAARAGDGRPSA